MSAEHDARLAQFLAGNPVPIDHLLRTLPETADLALAVEVVLRMVDHPHWLAGCGELPVRLVRGVLAAPPRTDAPGHLFLKLAIPADEKKAGVLKLAWVEAVEALRQLAETKHPARQRMAPGSLTHHGPAHVAHRKLEWPWGRPR